MKNMNDDNPLFEDELVEIDLPSGLIDTIDKYIEDHPEKGFEDRDEFARSAIRQFIKQY